MKYLFSTLGLVAAVACAVGFFAYRASGDSAVAEALHRKDAMEWLRTDFQLTDAQFARIKQLHDAYSTVCAEHCRQIQEAVHERTALAASSVREPAALAAADRRVEQLRLVCESAIATHVRQCAAEMSPLAAQRYLALVLPKIKDFDHQAPPDVHLNHSRH